MNKYKKIATAVVATVMAGTMVTSLAACGDGGNNGGPGNNGGGGYTPPSIEITKPNLSADMTPKTAEDNDQQLVYTSGTTLQTSLGYEKDTTGITFTTGLIQNLGGTSATSYTLAGKTYVSGNFKPAWQALQSKLGITLDDDWVSRNGPKASANIDGDTSHTGIAAAGGKGLAAYSLITASADKIVEKTADGSPWLNITDYLWYMPNYAKFLEANPIVRLSLTADASTGAMYMLPYFDGNDDIEKYVLMRKDIVEKILNTDDVSAATGTFASQASAKNGASTQNSNVTIVGTSSSVKSFMGKTSADNYKIAVTDPSVMTGTPIYGNDKTAVSNATATVDIVVDYGAALTAATTQGTALYNAINSAAGSAYNGTSGNIVDLQNYAINQTNGAVTGAQLITILKEYIKVAYHKEGTNEAFYTKLSDVFNSAYAAWDVDLYVALGRCMVTSSALIGSSSKGEANSYMLGSRTGYTNRTYDIASMAGELYGVRGLTSRYANLYTYIDKDGKMVDARSKTATWEALANMSALAKEGLYYTGIGAKDGVASTANSTTNTGVQIYSSTDYVQTQTKNQFNSSSVEADYNYAPILTPVSRWDTNDDGKKDTVMRFTESWRGVKDGGFCVPVENVKGNPDKLSAVLTFIDYFFSNDGQILMTYGPQSTAGNITLEQGKTVNANYGTWYGNPYSGTLGGVSVSNGTASLESLKAAGVIDSYDGVQYFATDAYADKVFMYNNVLYTGTFYKGKQTPTLTDENISIFNNISEYNFTNHARYYLGSCLNLGVKSQSFEYQCTADCGLAGSDIVALAIVNGTIKHTSPVLDSSAYWYSLAPTTLPFDDRQLGQMKVGLRFISGMGDSGYNLFYANSKAESNLLTDIMYYGFDTTKDIAVTPSLNLKIPGSAQELVNTLNNSTIGLNTMGTYITAAWNRLYNYWNALIGASTNS